MSENTKAGDAGHAGVSEARLDAAKRKPPKSWRVCPECRGRATKIFSLSSGKYQCQQCDHKYAPPNGRLPAKIEWVRP